MPLHSAGVATTDRTSTARPGADDRVVRSVARADRWSERMQHWFAPLHGRRPQDVDVLWAVAMGVVQITGTRLYSLDEPSPWALDAFAYALLAMGPVALLYRRRWPEATLLVTCVAAAAYVVTGYPRGPAGLPAFLLAVVNAVMMDRRTFAWGVIVVTYPVFAWGPSVVPDEEQSLWTVADAITGHLWVPLVGAVAELVHVRVERRVERAHVQREAARRRISEERLRIARELHDVLAHTISLVNVQAGVALHLLDDRPEQARPALEAIKEASREALGELRSALDVLSRGLADEGAPQWAPRAPTAGLRDLDDLVGRTRAAGFDVELIVEGTTHPLSAGVDLAAFRVVQEAMTNVVRHAGDGARVVVRVGHTSDALVVRVEDDGGSGPAAGRSDGATTVGQVAGRGIAGMRERVETLDGSFDAGPRPGGGFRVMARLPLQDGA